MILVIEKVFNMQPYAYIIEMSYSIQHLQLLVNMRIKAGYVPHGAPQFAILGTYDVEDRNTYCYMQALVLPEVYQHIKGGTVDEAT